MDPHLQPSSATQQMDQLHNFQACCGLIRKDFFIDNSTLEPVFPSLDILFTVKRDVINRNGSDIGRNLLPPTPRLRPCNRKSNIIFRIRQRGLIRAGVSCPSRISRMAGSSASSRPSCFVR